MEAKEDWERGLRWLLDLEEPSEAALMLESRTEGVSDEVIIGIFIILRKEIMRITIIDTYILYYQRQLFLGLYSG